MPIASQDEIPEDEEISARAGLVLAQRMRRDAYMQNREAARARIERRLDEMFGSDQEGGAS